MSKLHLAILAGLSLALSSAANAHGSGGGAGGPPAPQGFSSGGNHNGFDHNPAGSTLSSSPRGWDQGKAGWKTNSADSVSATGTPLPDSALAPGFVHH